MKYLKFMPFNSVSNASRNKRELRTAKEWGFETFCYSSDDSIPNNSEKDSFVHIPSVTQKINYKMSKVQRVVTIFQNYLRLMKGLRKWRMDVVSCHNITALALAYFAWLFSPRKRPFLIYDSHEFELGRKKRNFVHYNCLKILEKFLLTKCAFSIMINDGIAEAVSNIHNLCYKHVIVRSTPEYWTIDIEVVNKRKMEICSSLNCPQDSCILGYSGYLTEHRGIENVLQAMSSIDNVYAFFVGDYQNDEYKNKMSNLIEKLGLNDRVMIHPSVNQGCLWEYLGACKVAVVMNDVVNENYQYALPNKFFEAIQSGIPVICSNTVEMKRLVDKYSFGIAVNPGNVDELVNAINRLLSDSDYYSELKDNVASAKNDLCWENEKKKLAMMFTDCFGEGNE